IAALALWLRAQRTYERLNLKTSERPNITRSNIVCAEPMPGDQQLLDRFVADLGPKVLGQLVQVVFEKMKLAGDAGSLLKIEDEIASAVTEAKKLWLAGPKAEQGGLFADDRRPEQEQLGLDLSGITDEAFWASAEERIYAALRAYAEGAENEHGYQRRLFAGDAARGFAFVHICREHYDAVLMNPPFGELAMASKAYVVSHYARTKNDIYAAFVERWLSKLASSGSLGAITSRLGFFNISFQKWREDILLGPGSSIPFLVDLGYGVLDSATVETAAYIVDKDRQSHKLFSFQLLTAEDKSSVLLEAINGFAVAYARPGTFLVDPAVFKKVPGAPFCYWPKKRI